MPKKRVGLTFHLDRKAPPYRAALEAVGLEVVDITPANPRTMQGLDGLCLSGGTDLDPSLYGQNPRPAADEPARDRDKLELALLAEAMAANKPVLAICRGMQLFNVYHGGSLQQHISGHREGEHVADVNPGTLLASIVGTGRHDVNSRHHQAVDRVGSSLTVSAISPDGVVEALEFDDTSKRFAVAVQWHPEDRTTTDEKDLALFRAFADACGEEGT